MTLMFADRIARAVCAAIERGPCKPPDGFLGVRASDAFVTKATAGDVVIYIAYDIQVDDYAIGVYLTDHLGEAMKKPKGKDGKKKC